MPEIKEIEAAIGAFEMLRALMLFDPTTGEDISFESLNRDNQELYSAALLAQTVLCERLDRMKGCEYCNCGWLQSAERRLADKFKFCPKCGRKLAHNNTTQGEIEHEKEVTP